MIARATLARLVATLGLVGCGGDAHPDTVDAAPTADADPTARCPGGAHLALRGAVVLDTSSIAAATVNAKVVGVAGLAGADEIVLSLRHAVPGDLATVGSYDVATTNLKYLDMASGSACAPGTCTGFFAVAGTYTVAQVQPRYQATFVLTQLLAHDDISDQAGAPIAGTVTGCIDVSSP